MRRRRLFALFGGAAVSFPFAAAAQNGCCRVIGVLAPNSKVFATLTLERDLAAFGWQPGRDVRLLSRLGAGSNDELPALAGELVAQKVDLIFAAGDQATIAAQRASTKIPIVGICDDMVGSRLVASMARPGGNTTGISILASELDVKRLQLLVVVQFGILASRAAPQPVAY